MSNRPQHWFHPNAMSVVSLKDRQTDDRQQFLAAADCFVHDAAIVDCCVG